MTRRSLGVLVAAGSVISVISGCSGDDVAEPSTATTIISSSTSRSTTGTDVVGVDAFPDVLDAVATFDPSSETWTFDVTMSSPYDTPERYADGWRVIGLDGTIYGTHTLAHDHAGEQPFTRRQSTVGIPDGVDEVIIEGRDQINGFGGRTVTIVLQNG